MPDCGTEDVIGNLRRRAEAAESALVAEREAREIADGRIKDLRFEAIGLHQALRKETGRAEQAEEALRGPGASREEYWRTRASKHEEALTSLHSAVSMAFAVLDSDGKPDGHRGCGALCGKDVCWLCAAEETLRAALVTLKRASLSAVPAQKEGERSEIENALNLLRSINGTLTTQTGLSMRDPETQLVEYERRCQSASEQITAIADRFEAIFAPQPEEEKDG